VLALSVGCGLLVDRVAGRDLDGPLIAPLGLATVIVIATFCTLRPSWAHLATPTCAAVAIAGFVVGRKRLLAGQDCHSSTRVTTRFPPGPA
jgi:hypothetical protein